jgi:hypothetical protein
LTSVTIPNSVTSIGGEAFENCTSLAAITVDALNIVYSSIDGVLFDKSQTTLLQCPWGKAGSYTIPNSVTNIGYNAFAYCSSLTSITIPNSVTSIEYGAFQFCGSLASVTIPDSVTTIEPYTFAYCSSLTSITIPNSVTSIEGGAFAYCTSLTSITIPNSVTSIEVAVVMGCTNLNEVYFTGNAPTLERFLGSPMLLGDTYLIVYYLPGTTGWGSIFVDRPTALWCPHVQTSGDSFGVQTNGFGFNLTWASGRIVVVEACTDLTNPTWSPLQTNTLIGDSFYFSDPEWTNYPGRFYRLRSL